MVKNNYYLTVKGVNALYGPFLISIRIQGKYHVHSKGCQCPIRAFFNFYFDPENEFIGEIHEVSMPYTGLF